MSTSTTPRRRPRFSEETEAWDEYLAATRDQPPARYGEVEPWAWKRLQNRLHAIRLRAQRRATRSAA